MLYKVMHCATAAKKCNTLYTFHILAMFLLL